jgi:hypothetical protein
MRSADGTLAKEQVARVYAEWLPATISGTYVGT